MRRIKIHIAFWSIFFIYTCIVDIITGEFIGILWQLVFLLTHHLVIAYSTYWALTKSSYKSFKSTLLSIGYIILSIIIYYVSLVFFREVILKSFYTGYRPITNIEVFIISGLAWYIQFVIFGIAFYFGDKLIKKERQLRISEMRRYQLESAFLRSQINPHFLHNILNFFYSKSLNGNAKELSEGILTLSEIMRYSLDSQHDSDHRVSLAKEVEHLHNFIKINQLRFAGKLNVQFDVSDNTHGFSIIPLVLVTLVENAFKHGDLNDKQHPLGIKLEAEENKNDIVFFVRNKKKKGPKEPSHGIGIENTRKRLDSAYGKEYSLNIEQDAEFYTAILTIRPGKENVLI